MKSSIGIKTMVWVRPCVHNQSNKFSQFFSLKKKKKTEFEVR